jgi:glutamate formiminotransferase/formiminotetrahydrofolate cyclodeaminase
MYYLEKAQTSKGIPEKDVIDIAIKSMGLNDVAEFDPEKKIIGAPSPPGDLMSMVSWDFVDEVSRDSPAPGGGSIAALAGALGAALSSMVCNLTFTKEGYEEVKEEMEQTAIKAQEIKDKLSIAVDEDTLAFNELFAAFGMPKDTEEQKKARDEAVQEGYKKAAAVPLQTAKLCFEALKLCHTAANHGNKASITDAGVGAWMARTGIIGAIYNVKINLVDIKDEEFNKEMRSELDQLINESKTILEEVDGFVSGEIDK